MSTCRPPASLSPHLLILRQSPARPEHSDDDHTLPITYLLGVDTVGLPHQPAEHVQVGLLLLQLARGELLTQGTVVRHAGEAADVREGHGGYYRIAPSLPVDGVERSPGKV